MKNILVVGSSGHAKVIVDILNNSSTYRIVGFLDPFREQGEITMGIPVLGNEEEIPFLARKFNVECFVLGLGDNYARFKTAEKFSCDHPSALFPTVIHPSANIGRNVTIGKGSVVMAGATVNACSRVGCFCIINTHASLDHDSVLEDYASLAPGVVTGGNCHIGKHSAIGIGSVIAHNTTIGENSVIGASSLVLNAVGDNVVAFGAPAKVIRSRKLGDKYL